MCLGSRPLLIRHIIFNNLNAKLALCLKLTDENLYDYLRITNLIVD